MRGIMKRNFLLLFLMILWAGSGTAFAEDGSAGDLGKQYGLKFTKAIVIGPIHQVERGKLPVPPVLEDPELEDKSRPESGEQQFAFAFNPYPDFDEYIRNRYTEDLLFESLHIGGSRMSRVLTPVTRVDIAEMKQGSRQARAPRATPRPSSRK